MNWAKILKQKTTWTGLLIIVNAPLLAFGVDPKIVAGIAAVVAGLAVIFQRQATQKLQDNTSRVDSTTDTCQYCKTPLDATQLTGVYECPKCIEVFPDGRHIADIVGKQEEPITP